MGRRLYYPKQIYNLVNEIAYICIIITISFSFRKQILWRLLLAIRHNWLKLGIYLYVSFGIICYLYVDADQQLLFAEMNNGQSMQYVWHSRMIFVHTWITGNNIWGW